MRKIGQIDITGARIVDIHETYELSEGLDVRIIYFTVDRGFTFTLPDAGMAWTTVQLPSNAKQVPDESVQESFAVKYGWFGRIRLSRLPSTNIDSVKQIKRRVIAGVYCGPFDKNFEFFYPANATLVFEDGAQASNTIVAPYGTGHAGLNFFAAGSPHCADIKQIVDYFTIPVDDASRSDGESAS